MIKTKTAITFLLVCASSVAISFAVSAKGNATEEESYYESVIETMNNKEVVSTIRESKHVEREIEEDLTGFVDDFNHSDYLNDVVLRNVENKEEYALDATSIEYSNSVYIIEKEIYGTYLDFNEDNGYAVIGSNRTIYEIQIEGDLEELRDGQDLLYSTLDGFVYFDENNVCQRMFENLEPSYMDTIDDKDEIDETDLDYYVAVPDLGSYTYIGGNIKLIDDFKCTRQYKTSYYRQVACNKKGVALSDNSSSDSSEGNCSPTAMFHVMSSWAQNGKISGVDYTSTTDVSKLIESDPFYETYITEGKVKKGSDNYYYWRTNDEKYLTAMPSLYVDIRNNAYSEGFDPENGLSYSEVDNVLMATGNDYGINITASETTNLSNVFGSINGGKAVYMSIRKSKIYGDGKGRHGVALLGYEIYTHTSTIATYRTEETIYYYYLADGWHDEITIYNPSEDEGNVSFEFVIKG